MRNLLVTAAVLLGFTSATFAGEGMWLPLLIKRLNHTDMQKHGLQLTAEEIYSINNSSLKDAIVALGGGFCTGEMISSQGLMLTNHHCAFDAIQQNSTTEHDYLTDGFWAMTKNDEIHIPGLTAYFLESMDDVTDIILKDVSDKLTSGERMQAVQMAIQGLTEKENKGNPNLTVQIKSFFEGNEYYIFRYKVYEDVRLVGAPPSSIGKFGGDTDNWMWPRQTGDFGMFRVYAGSDNEPAAYATENKPLAPKHHLPVSLQGVKEGDYAMIMGFPGSTDRFLTSYGVKLATEKDQPSRVKIRGKKLDIMKESMDADPKVRIQYASKYAQVSNYWKYFIGQTRGLKRLKVYEKKKAEEDAFRKWVLEDKTRAGKYATALDLIEQSYKTLEEYNAAQTYLNEAVFGVELNLNIWMMFGRSALAQALQGDDEAKIKEAAKAMIEGLDETFKDYHAPTDQKIYAAMLKFYAEDIPVAQQPQQLIDINKKYKGDFDKYAAKYFAKSPFTSKAKLTAFLNTITKAKLEKDQGYQLTMGFIQAYREKIIASTQMAEMQKQEGRRLYIAGMMEMNKNKNYYPDANSTLRVTYGNIKAYDPMDAVTYKYYSTLEGVMEKENPDDCPNGEFCVPAKLKELYEAKDYGMYAENGKLHVGFISDNDITGGNSGSPVINGKGHLIGCAFDGNWEAMSGDIAFEPELQRTISVDIRYILFVIDKYAGAKHLIDEMTLVMPETKGGNDMHKKQPATSGSSN